MFFLVLQSFRWERESWLFCILHSRLFISKNEGKIQESIQSNTTPDPGYQWESDNVTIRHHKREPRGQPFPSR